MKHVSGTQYYYLVKTLRLGMTHQYEYFDGLASRSGVMKWPATTRTPIRLPGVPRGKLSERRRRSRAKIYPGMTANYWVYVNPGADTSSGAPLMVWQDGETIVGNLDLLRLRLQIVSDNLVAQEADSADGARSDSPGEAVRAEDADAEHSVRYGVGRLRQVSARGDSAGGGEDVQAPARTPIRARSPALRQARSARSTSRGISRAVQPRAVAHRQLRGASMASGEGAGWRLHRLATGCGASRRRIMRVWMSDGADDSESRAGSWPLNNIMLANSLKMKGYDFHFRFGESVHAIAQGALDLPESLAWLWRDYDPAKTEQTYEMEESERNKPCSRVSITNRDAW